MAKPKYLISEDDFALLRKRAAKEYYEFRVLQKPKTKSMTPLAKNVHNIRIQRRAHIRHCSNNHYIMAKRIAAFRDGILHFRRNATLYDADILNRGNADIISKMKHCSVTDFLNLITRIETDSGKEGYVVDLGGWHWASLSYDLFKQYESGKWMSFFSGDNYQWASSIVDMAVIQGICECAKCSLPTHLNKRGSGVICLYGDATDYAFHKHCTQFMIDHQMIRKTKGGLYYNISFKMDWMTRLGLYDITGDIKLSDIRDLRTGDWIYEGAIDDFWDEEDISQTEQHKQSEAILSQSMGKEKTRVQLDEHESDIAIQSGREKNVRTELGEQGEKQLLQKTEDQKKKECSAENDSCANENTVILSEKEIIDRCDNCSEGNTECYKYEIINYDNLDDFKQYAISLGAVLVDNRFIDGCIWIKSDSQIDEIIQKTWIKGRQFKHASGCKVLDGGPGWYY